MKPVRLLYLRARSMPTEEIARVRDLGCAIQRYLAVDGMLPEIQIGDGVTVFEALTDALAAGEPKDAARVITARAIVLGTPAYPAWTAFLCPDSTIGRGSHSILELAFGVGAPVFFAAGNRMPISRAGGMYGLPGDDWNEYAELIDEEEAE